MLWSRQNTTLHRSPLKSALETASGLIPRRELWSDQFFLHVHVSANLKSWAAMDAQDERACRVCFESHDADEDRLFRPCLCDGTQAYIHESCLAAWRESASNPSSYYECPTCRYRYQLRRIGIYHLITHHVLLALLTPLAAASMLLLVSYALKLLAMLASSAGLIQPGAYLREDHFLSLSFENVAWAFILTGLVAFGVGLEGGELAFPDYPSRSAVTLWAFIGFCYVVYRIFLKVRSGLRGLLRGAGDQVLEIKKRQ